MTVSKSEDKKFNCDVRPEVFLQGDVVDLVVAIPAGQHEKDVREAGGEKNIRYEVDWKLPPGERIREASDFGERSITKHAHTGDWEIGKDRLEVRVVARGPDEVIWRDRCSAEFEVVTFVPDIEFKLPDEQIHEDDLVEFEVAVVNEDEAPRDRKFDYDFEVLANNVALPVVKSKKRGVVVRYEPRMPGTYVLKATVTATPKE